MSYFSASYKKYDEELRCEVAKHVVFCGARLTVKKCSPSESTVGRFVKSLKREQADDPDFNFIALPEKKGVDQNSYLKKSMKKLSV